MPDPRRFTIKQHDTYPAIRATLADQTGPVSLQTASQVRLLLKTKHTSIERTAVIDPDQITNPGKVAYTWVTGDTAIAAVYDCEFEVTWGDGTIETFPNDSYNVVEFKRDLG